MEQNFQTSFIPKKPILAEEVHHREPLSLLTVAAVFIFFTMLFASGGLYFYRAALAKNITQMKDSLTAAQNRFEPERLSELQALDKRLDAARMILATHIAPSPLLEALGAITMKTVRYTKFTYTLNEKTSQINVHLIGEAVGYRAVALQSDLFAKNKNFIDPVFSNLALDDKGNVLFDLDFLVDASLVNYKNMVDRENSLVPQGTGL